MFTDAQVFFPLRGTERISPHFYRGPDTEITTDQILQYIFSRASLPNPKNTTTFIKIYGDKPHGIRAREAIFPVPMYPVDAFSVSTMQHIGIFQEQHPDCLNIACGVCSTIIDQITGTTYQIPMVDLELDATGDPPRDLKEAIKVLVHAGLTGFLIQSGDPGIHRGSYHFMGDTILRIELHHLIGELLLHLTDPRNEPGKVCQQFGTELLQIDNFRDSLSIAEAILEHFPTIPSGERRPGLFVDTRHLAHAILDNGACVLRATTGKGYATPPTLVGEIF